MLLRVIPNPFIAYDKDNRLTGAVRWDPDFGRPGQVHHVGARVRQTVVADLNEKNASARGHAVVAGDPSKRREGYIARHVLDPLRQVEVTYDFATVEIPHTDHHLRMLRDRALIPANAATAKLAGVPFVPVAEALEAARERLRDQWSSENPEAEADEQPTWPTVAELLGAPNNTPAKPAPTESPTARAAAGGDA